MGEGRAEYESHSADGLHWTDSLRSESVVLEDAGVKGGVSGSDSGEWGETAMSMAPRVCLEDRGTRTDMVIVVENDEGEGRLEEEDGQFVGISTSWAPVETSWNGN